MPLFRGEHSRADCFARSLIRCVAWSALSGVCALPAIAQTDGGASAVPPAPPAASAPAALPAPPPATAAASRDPVIRTVGAISYVCGGVGEDEQQRMKARRQYFNLALLFTQGARGEYLSDVEVRLMRDGHDVARFRADGPLCLIKAPEGGYNVHATFNGQPRSVNVRTGSTDSTQVRW